MSACKYIIILLIVGNAIILQSSCRHEPIIPENNEITDITDTTGTGTGGSGGGGTSNDPCDPDTVYFQNTILPLLVSNCAQSGCHDFASHQDGIIIEDYQTIISSDIVTPFDLGDSEMFEVITETDLDKIMPPPPEAPLNNEQISLIAQWINQGAQNNGCTQCDTSNVTFSMTIKPIIDLKCKGCHSGALPSGGVNLENHMDVFTVAMSGQLINVIDHSAGYPAMPPSGGKIPQCEIDQIQIWINNGALNN